MVEGIPAFFAASRNGGALIALMAVVFALSTILTYVALCVLSTAGLQRIPLGPVERYGEAIFVEFLSLWLALRSGYGRSSEGRNGKVGAKSLRHSYRQSRVGCPLFAGMTGNGGA